MCISDWSSDVCSSDLAFDLDHGVNQPVFERIEHEQDRRIAAIVCQDMRPLMVLIGDDITGLRIARGQVAHVRGPFIQPKPKPSCSNRFERSEAHTSELESLMRISYAVFYLKTKRNSMN